jgi:hypothetical protein
MRRFNPRIAAEMLLGMVRGVNRYHGRSDTLEDMVGAVVNVFWHGVAVDSPRVREHNGRKRRR